jgi:hypothetical protein
MVYAKAVTGRDSETERHDRSQEHRSERVTGAEVNRQSRGRQSQPGNRMPPPHPQRGGSNQQQHDAKGVQRTHVGLAPAGEGGADDGERAHGQRQRQRG